MDSEVIFWLVSVFCGIAFLLYAIHRGNKELRVEWVNDLQDKY